MGEREARAPGTTVGTPDRPRTARISAHESQPLVEHWTLASLPADLVTHPRDLAALSLNWRPACVPGTVASSRAAQNDEGPAPDADASDWWFRTRFAAVPTPPGTSAVLCLDGLATLADVWINGHHVVSSTNMFAAHEVDVTNELGAKNDLAIRFRSLTRELDRRRPRPRWRTKLVEHQQLRWHRATLLGRMPGWSPPIRAVGPWRGVRVERRALLELVAGDIHPVAEPTGGRVEAALTVRPLGTTELRSATIQVADWNLPLTLSPGIDGTVTLRGVLRVPDALHWWPHTHGGQDRYPATVLVITSEGPVEIVFGEVAFRHVAVDQSSGGFGVMINDVPVFCRGACWTTSDIASLQASPERYRQLLTLARDAGMNMLRVSGTMIYEADLFYDLCDELGIMVWQDFMFANMDYPSTDETFMNAVREEAHQTLARLRRHPSLVVLCGNSEVAQQAAMLGHDASKWSNTLFDDLLPTACADWAPGIPYWPSSPSGGALPFHTDAGVSHYYGVGAYLRPLEDARRSNVRFTSECLGFANVPRQAAVELLLPNGESAVHHPRWKERVPRDHGTGWDFEDVRDHYLALLFGVDPARLRYAEMDRYLALSRVVTGEVMARTIGEWRRPGSSCRGALVWFFQDLWLGAGFGIVDSSGAPKAAYYAVKRAMQPLGLALTDEGANGVHVHLANDRPTPVVGELAVALYRGYDTVVAVASAPCNIPARSAITMSADAVLGRFHDTAYAYRFGAAGHDLLVATLRDSAGQLLGECVHFPSGIPSARTQDILVTGQARRLASDVVSITLQTRGFASYVEIDAGPYVADDNYFHMTPGSERTVIARSPIPDAPCTVFVQPLNAHDVTRLTVAGNATVLEGESPR